MTTFTEFLSSLGLVPRSVSPDGKWRRCPTRVDQAAMKEAHRKAMAEQAAAIRRAVEFYRDCAPLRDGHPYMERQGLSMAGAFGVRVDQDGWLVVPGYRDGQMVTYQRISPAGEKRFATGAPVQGSCHTIERRGATMTVVVEGWATGMAIFQAVRDSRVIVAWHSSNLSHPWKIGRGWRVVGADNDYRTAERTGTNPGVAAGERAAQVLRCGFAFPEGIEGTDWADYRRERYAQRRSEAPRSETEAVSLRVVDSEIQRALAASARFL
jgi:putative DNA primase/helicase